MKRIVLSCMVGLTLCCAKTQENSGEFKEHISKEFSVKANSTFALYNINGRIQVEGYDGDKVIIEVDKTISGKTESIVEEGKKEFKLAFEQKADSVIAYISEPWDSRPNRNQERYNDHKKIDYHYNMDFVIKIPKSLNLHASTVNGGDVVIKNVEGILEVTNVNGKIDIENAKNTSQVHTVNGGITVNYLNNPTNASSYRTINGDIKVTFKNDLAADLSFKSMHGEFYTDFENVEKLASEIHENTQKRGNSTAFKIDSKTSVRIGNGGKKIKFETLNGNVYIKKG